MANRLGTGWNRLREEIETLLDEGRLFRRGGRNLSAFQQFVHFWMMVGRSFMTNRCPVRASALAYTTLLALIPLLAVGIGVSASLIKNKEGTNPGKELVDKLVTEIAPQLGLIHQPTTESAIDARQQVVDRINDFIANVHSGTLGVTGTVALVFVAIMLLSNIEATFNDIWGVTRGRNWVARVVQYWAAITLGPLFVVLALGLTVSSQFQAVREWMAVWPVTAELVFTFMPLAILILIFTLFYQLIPNTRVSPRAALIGGLVGGLLWSLNSTLNVLFASRVITASKIYGSLGAIPVFLTGLYFSWLILLFGAQVAYAFQNRQTYLQERQAETVNQRGREFVAFRLMALIGGRFEQGLRPPTAAELAEAMEVPSRLVSELLHRLTSGQLLVEVAQGDLGYAPARPIDRITCREILDSLRCGNGQELETREEPARAAVREDFQRIRDAEETAAGGITVADLVRHAAGPRA